MILKSYATPFFVSKSQIELKEDAAKFLILFNDSMKGGFEELTKEMVEAIVHYFRTGKFELYEDKKLRMHFNDVVMKKERAGRKDVIISHYKHIMVEFLINASMNIESIHEVFGIVPVNSEEGSYQTLYTAFISHPHVSGSRLCSGGLEETFRAFMACGNFVGAYNTLRRFFSGFLSDAPYFHPTAGGDREQLGPYEKEMAKANANGEIENWRYRAVTHCQEIQNALFGLYSPLMAGASQSNFFKDAKINVLSEQAARSVAVALCAHMKLSITDFGLIAKGQITFADWGI